MPATIGAGIDVRSVFIQMVDDTDETIDMTWDLDGATSDADIEQALDDLETVTNGAFTLKCHVTDKKLITGMQSVASASAYNLVSIKGYMTFTKVHPLNASKQVRKTAIIPSLLTALFDKPSHSLVFGDPVTVISADDNLARLRDFLIANLTYKAVDDTWYGGFDSLVADGLVTTNANIDGL